ADNRRLLCAAPPYLERCSAPAHPVDLAQHNCLCFRLGDHTYNRWRFVRGDERVEVDVVGNRSSDDSDAVRHWAVAGHGICYRSWLDVARDVTAGRLRVLCQDWQGETVPLNLVCANRRLLSPTIRLLREHLEARFAGLANTHPHRQGVG